MVTRVMCDVRDCGRTADFAATEIADYPYLLSSTNGKLDLCLKHFQEWTYKGGGTYIYQEKNDDPRYPYADD
jgi:hypothetical protein